MCLRWVCVWCRKCKWSWELPVWTRHLIQMLSSATVMKSVVWSTWSTAGLPFVWCCCFCPSPTGPWLVFSIFLHSSPVPPSVYEQIVIELSWFYFILHGFIEKHSLEEEELVMNPLKTANCQFSPIEFCYGDVMFKHPELRKYNIRFNVCWSVLLLTLAWVCWNDATICVNLHSLGSLNKLCNMKTTQVISLWTYNNTTTTTVLQRFVRDYLGEPVPEKHSPTHHHDHPIFISFFHLPRSIASFLFKLRAWQSFCTTSFHVLFGLPLGVEPSTSYSIHFFTQPAHAHTIATCFAVVSILHHLFLVFLSTPYLALCLLP